MAGTKKCCVRIDDVCPTMDYEQFKRALDLLDDYSVKPLLGIIPQNEDPELKIESSHADFWSEMRNYQKRGYPIAMHGCSHVYDSNHSGMINKSKKSEFAGHRFNIQLEKIRKGHEVLQKNGIHTDVFFAPSHSYDKNTLRALKAIGFRFISDGRANKPYKQKGIICIPAKSFSIPNVKRRGIYTAIIHPSEWTREDKRTNYDLLKKWLEQNKDYLTDFCSLKKEKLGCFLVQKTYERAFVKWNCYIKPFLIRIRNKLKGFWQ